MQAAFWLLKTACPRRMSPSLSDPSSSSRRCVCFAASTVERREQCLAPLLHGLRILRQPRTEHVGAHARSARSTARAPRSSPSPSASSVALSNAGSRRDSSSGPAILSSSASVNSCSRSSLAFSMTRCGGAADARRAGRVEAGPQELEHDRVDAGETAGDRGQRVEPDVRPAPRCRARRGAARREARRPLPSTAGGRAHDRHRLARHVDVAAASARTSGAIQAGGSSLARVRAMARSAVTRVVRRRRRARRSSASRSWIAGFSPNWASFCCRSSRSAALSRVAVSRCWK